MKLYDRTAYLMFALEFPHLRGADLLSAVKYKLNSLYPGDISEKNIQIKKNGAKKWSYLIFVLDKNTGKKMLPLSTLFIKQIYAQKTANVLYADKKWLEYICIENGTIVSSTAIIRDEDSLVDDIRNICDLETKLIVYCDETDKTLFIQFNINNNIQFLDCNTELKKVDVHKISLFSEKSPVIKFRRIMIVILMLIILVTGIILMYRHQQNEKERYARQRFEQQQQKAINLEKQREAQYLAELKQQYKEIISTKTVTPFDIAAVIAECSGTQTRIQSATYNRSFFQIEGISNNALELLSRFEKHRLIKQVRLHQVHPEGNRETFTLSGTVFVESVSIDDSELTVSEQIELLQNLIAAEQYYDFESQLSPSAFGLAVQTLFAKWNCTINSYQFMNEPQRTEIEYSIRGSGNGFFNALYEVKTKHRLWDIHLTQIKNLYPRNLLDIVIRIRTEYLQPDAAPQIIEPVNTANTYPVAIISRNFFIPASLPAPRVQEIIRETPAPVPTPQGIEKVSWLEYIGSISDDSGNNSIYVKNSRTGSVIRLGQSGEGDMRYANSQSGGIIAYIDGHIYEISRR